MRPCRARLALSLLRKNKKSKKALLNIQTMVPIPVMTNDIHRYLSEADIIVFYLDEISTMYIEI